MREGYRTYMGKGPYGVGTVIKWQHFPVSHTNSCCHGSVSAQVGCAASRDGVREACQWAEWGGGPTAWRRGDEEFDLELLTGSFDRIHDILQGIPIHSSPRCGSLGCCILHEGHFVM